MMTVMMPEFNSQQSRSILSFHDYTSARDKKAVQRRWTNNGDRIVFNALAADLQSDIAGYEYCIGTTPGGDDVRGWSEAVGVPVLDVNQAGSMGNALRRITVHGLALEEGVPYFVSVRATNGAGLTSSVATDSRGVVFRSEERRVGRGGRPGGAAGR